MNINQIYKLFLASTGVSTDTRKVTRGNLFFALRGPNFNANSFASAALQLDALAVVIDDDQFFIDENKTILVSDSLKTLQQLATHHRRQMKCPVIAITGSNGKTTTKELTFSVLSSSFKTFCTQGNLNNHIGVPLTLLSIPADAEMVVIELGANHIEENKFLCEVAEPDFGLITNNGMDHLEGYGNIEGVRKGNGEVYEFLKLKKATAFVSALQKDLMLQSENMNRIIYGDDKSAIVRGKVLDSFPYLKSRITFIDGSDFDVQTQLVGTYNLENILAAAAIGLHFNVSQEKIKYAIENYQPANNRSQQKEINGNHFILDAYNANPSSMSLALENFSLFPVENKIAILGDMAELGIYSEAEHKKILKQAAEFQFNEIWLVGNNFKSAVEKSVLKNSVIKTFASVLELKKYFGQQHFSQYYFLLKGSRVNKLEMLIE